MKSRMLFVLLLLVQGCASGSSGPPDHGKQVRAAEVARTQSLFAKLPGVTAAEVLDVRGPAVTGTREAVVRLTTGATADRKALTAVVVEAIWKSRIAPIDAITIDFSRSDHKTPTETVDVSLDGGPDEKALRAKYGDRPSP